MNLAKLYILITAISALVLSGCNLAPQYSRPDTPFDANDGYINSYNKPIPVDFNEIDNWWKTFGDDTTTELVEKMLENNYDLKLAAARVTEAKANLDRAGGQRLPQATYNFSRNRGKALPGTPAATSYNQQISVSYALDIFGKLKNTQQAALSDLLATKANRQAMVNSLIATTIKARVDIATLERRLDIAKANTASLSSTRDIVEQRYKKGLVSPVDVRLARENLANARTAEPQLSRSLARARHSLDVLTGQRPGTGQELSKTLAALPDLRPVPIGIPAYLLDRRPDLLAAEMQIKAANQRVGVSVAQLYPDLTLSAAYGTSGDNWSNLWKDQNEIYSAVFAATQPIFRGGQLKAEVRASKARHAQAVANYSKTLLNALQEVEDALVNETLFLEQLGYTKTRLSEAEKAEQLSRERYQRGVERLLTVLESERRRRQAETELELLRQLVWNNRINLVLSLGGNWSDYDMDKEKVSAQKLK
jgi:NodT family efflux transporter outer membrane factor (OMF) lipoprotein